MKFTTVDSTAIANTILINNSNDTNPQLQKESELETEVQSKSVLTPPYFSLPFLILLISLLFIYTSSKSTELYNKANALKLIDAERKMEPEEAIAMTATKTSFMTFFRKGKDSEMVALFAIAANKESNSNANKFNPNAAPCQKCICCAVVKCCGCGAGSDKNL